MLHSVTDEYTAALFRRAPAGMWHRWDVEPFVPSGVALDAPLLAEVNHGRWIVQCPCGGAQFTAPGIDRFFCVDCLNESVGGQWVAISWDGIDVGGIEAALVEREPVNQNWLGETVGELREETERGGPLPVESSPVAHFIAPGTELHPDSEMA
jgi:hypothetical protein